jgi:tetratricopeptide (TPR) repeat protein
MNLLKKTAKTYWLLVISGTLSLATSFNSTAVANLPILVWVAQGNVSYTDEADKTNKIPLKTWYTVKYGGYLKTSSPNSKIVRVCGKKAPTVPNNQTPFRSLFPNQKETIAKLCPSVGPNLGNEIAILKGGLEQNIPYIISPRYTLYSNTNKQLFFQWNAVAGVSKYTLSLYLIQQGNRNNPPIWSDTVLDKPHTLWGEKVRVFQYPASAQQIKPDTEYELVISATKDGKKISSDDEASLIDLDQYNARNRGGVSKLRFQVVSQEIQAKLASDLSIYDNADLPIADKEFAKASVYAGNNFYAEAIQKLENVAKDSINPNITDYYHLLGDLYAQSGLNNLACGSYSRAIKKNQAAQSGISSGETLTLLKNKEKEITESLQNLKKVMGQNNSCQD